MPGEVWVRVVLMLGALIALFLGLGIFVQSEASQPVGAGIARVFALLNLQDSAETAGPECPKTGQSKYMPFGRPRPQETPQEAGNDSSNSGSESSQDNSNNSSGGTGSVPGSSSGPSSSNFPSGGIRIDSGAFEWLFWLAVIIAALVVIALIYYLISSRSGRLTYRESGGGGFSGGGGVAVYASPSDALTEAERLAALGQYREALRMLYSGILHRLSQLGLIELEKRRTNWELLRLLHQRGEQEIHNHLLPLTQLFERAWYGQTPISAGEYQSARQATQQILGGAKSA